ncbi:MAG: hypothetical protein U5N85_09845 [Arcicella sp.]|nr:hypothetical protein [Arcicella sp.]
MQHQLVIAQIAFQRVLQKANFPNTGNEGFCAAQYLCNLGIIQPQQNNAGYTPVDPIKRADLAKLMLYALFDDGYAGTYHQNPGILTNLRWIDM